MNKLFSSFLAFAVLFASCLALPATAQDKTHLGEAGFKIIGVTDVASVTVGTAGTGYTSAPTVTFSGGGALGGGATGTSRLKAVGSITVAAGGSDYEVGDVLTLVGGTKTTTATFTVATVSSGAVTAVTITNAGVYTVPVTASGAATTSPSGGTGATLTVGWGVASVVVTNAGHGFTSAPTVAFSGGGGSSAAATASLTAIAAVDVKFRAIIPLATTVVDEITVPTRLYDTKYSGDTDIEGVTLAAGIEYPVYGNSILLESGGLAIVILR